ncbi:MAG: hypothetical protein WDO13_03145 [Verrucomicrobiota bacterium]
MALAQQPRNGLVQRRESLARVDHEDDFRGRSQREIDLVLDRVLEAFPVLHADAAGVDEREPVVAPARAGHQPVARGAGTVEDEGNVAPGQRVEERGLADVGAADDGDGGFHKNQDLAEGALVWPLRLSSARPWRT